MNLFSRIIFNLVIHATGFASTMPAVMMFTSGGSYCICKYVVSSELYVHLIVVSLMPMTDIPENRHENRALFYSVPKTSTRKT